MSEHPIIFSGEMMRAILDGHKTQTRRPMKPQPSGNNLDILNRSYGGAVNENNFYLGLVAGDMGYEQTTIKCPFGGIGDRLWVKETWRNQPQSYDEASNKYGDFKIEYRADFNEGENACYGRRGGLCPKPWKPSIFMPRWASRITLEIINVRVEQVRNISEDDARAEGVKDPYEYQASEYYDCHSVKDLEINQASFAGLWDSLYAARGMGWDANPFCWVIEFKMIEAQNGAK